MIIIWAGGGEAIGAGGNSPAITDLETLREKKILGCEVKGSGPRPNP